MSGDVDILPEHAIDVATKSSKFDVFSDIAMDMVQCKVWADTISNFPLLDLFPKCNNLACTIRARNDIPLLPVRSVLNMTSDLKYND